MRKSVDRAPAMAAVPRKESGFTVIEIMIAVALSALLLTIVYGTYFSINRSIDAATEDQDALETGRILLELIKKDIRGINLDRSGLVGKNDVVEDGSLGQIEFVTSAGLPTDPLKLRRIGYALITNDRGEKIFIKRVSTDLSDPLDSSASAPQVFEVSRIIKRFQLEFYNGTDWTAAWDSDTAGAFPKQIRVTIDVADTKGHDKKFVAEETIQSTL